MPPCMATACRSVSILGTCLGSAVLQCCWGWGASWTLGMVQTWQGDPASLGLRAWVGAWLLVLLPSAARGIAEDMTQRLTVRYRLAFTAASGVLAVALLGTRRCRGWTCPGPICCWPMRPGSGLPLHCWRWRGCPCLQHHRWLQRAGGHGRADCVPGAGPCGAAGGRPGAGGAAGVHGGGHGGFLVWNYPRGMLFAGDGGAYIWGVVIALASVSLVQRNVLVSPWFPLLLLIYPVWETIFSIYRKLVRGVSPGWPMRCIFTS